MDGQVNKSVMLDLRTLKTPCFHLHKTNGIQEELNN
jgi:hypothetical protein